MKMKKSLFKKLKNIVKPEKIGEILVNEHSLPECILNNPEFKHIKDFFDRDGSSESEGQIKDKLDSSENVVCSGSGLLVGKSGSNLYGNYSYKITSISKREKADVKCVEFNIDITDKEYLELIKCYGVKIPKSIRFEVLPHPESFELPRAKNKNLDTSQIVKVTQEDFNDNSFTEHYDKNGLDVKMYSRELFGHILMPREPEL